MYTAIINERTYAIGQEGGGHYTVNGRSIQPDLQSLGMGHYHLILDQRSYNIELLEKESGTHQYTLKVNGKKMTVQLKSPMDLLLSKLGFDIAGQSKVNMIKAPMPGMVLSVYVEQGQSIRKGDPILVLEAMKMENVIKSPTDGTVGKVHVKARDKVEKNQVLLDLD